MDWIGKLVFKRCGFDIGDGRVASVIRDGDFCMKLGKLLKALKALLEKTKSDIPAPQIYMKK